MINSIVLKDLDNVPSRKLKGDDGATTLPAIREALEKALIEEGIDAEITSDEISVKTGFLSKETYPCIVIRNKQHPTDYFNYCISTKPQGRNTIVDIKYFGTSKLTGDDKVRNQDVFGGGFFAGAKTLIKKATFNQQAYEQEYEYYEMIDEVLNELFG